MGPKLYRYVFVMASAQSDQRLWYTQGGASDLYLSAEHQLEALITLQRCRVWSSLRWMEKSEGILFRPCHAITCLRAYADSECPDQPAHPRSTIGISLSDNKIIRYYIIYEWEAKVGWYIAHAQNDMNLCSLRMFEGTFSPGAAPFIWKLISQILPTSNNLWMWIRTRQKYSCLTYCIPCLRVRIGISLNTEKGTLLFFGLWSFKCSCAVPYLGYRHVLFCFYLMLPCSLLHVCEQQSLWRDCAYEQARLSLCWSPMP